MISCKTGTCRLNFPEQTLHGICRNQTRRRCGRQAVSHVVPSGSSLGFLTEQDQQDSFSACSTAGHAAARDEVLTGHGPGNGSSGVEQDCLISAIKYQDAFTNSFSWQKNE